MVLARVQGGTEAIARATIPRPRLRHGRATVVLAVPREVLDAGRHDADERSIGGQGGIEGGAGTPAASARERRDDHVCDATDVAVEDDVAARAEHASRHAAHETRRTLEDDRVDGGHDRRRHDGRRQVGGRRCEEQQARRRCEGDTALDRRQRVDGGHKVVVQGRHPIRVQEPDGVAVEDEPVGIQAAQVDPVLEAVVRDGPQRRLHAVPRAVAAGDLCEVVGVDASADRCARIRDAAHGDVPHRHTAGLGGIDDGRGDGSGVPIAIALAAQRPVEGNVIDTRGGRGIDTRCVATRGRRRPGHLLCPSRHRPEARLRCRTGEVGERQRDRQR